MKSDEGKRVWMGSSSWRSNGLREEINVEEIILVCHRSIIYGSIVLVTGNAVCKEDIDISRVEIEISNAA